VVSSLFSIKAVHWRDASEFAMNGEGKRQREPPEIRSQRAEIKARSKERGPADAGTTGQLTTDHRDSGDQRSEIRDQRLEIRDQRNTRGAVRTSVTLLGQNIGNTVSIVVFAARDDGKP
jgi:hypothetical protein